MITKTVMVEIEVKVEVDETKFTPQFLSEFSRDIFPADMDDHFRHLALLHAAGKAENSGFVDGYGPIQEMGIKLDIAAESAEVLN